MKSVSINDKKRVLWKKVKSSRNGRGEIVKDAAIHGREQGGELIANIKNK